MKSRWAKLHFICFSGLDERVRFGPTADQLPQNVLGGYLRLDASGLQRTLASLMKTPVRWFWLGAIVWPLLVVAARADSAPQVRLMRVPHGGVQPQALMDAVGTLHLVYLEGDPKACDVMYARRLARRTNFCMAVRVNSTPGSAIAIGTVRGAQLALGRNGRVNVAWNGSDRVSTSPAGATPMLYSRLNDAGDAFEPQRNLMTSTTHLDGGGSVAADGSGRVYVVWHAHKKIGPQEEIDRGVFVAFSEDDGKTFTAERQVNPPETGACGCCGLKAFADQHGSVAILFRSAGLSGDRDSTLLLSTNYGASFTTRVLGRWHVSTCPMSTHAMGLGGDALFGSWEKEGQIYYASIFPGLLDPVSDPVAVSGTTGNRKHPTFARGGAGRAPLVIAWTEGTGWEKGGALAWECLDANGVRTGSGRVGGIPVWSFAAAAAETDGSFTLIY